MPRSRASAETPATAFDVASRAAAAFAPLVSTPTTTSAKSGARVEVACPVTLICRSHGASSAAAAPARDTRTRTKGAALTSGNPR